MKYCSHCLSLRITGWDEESCFCDECGGTVISEDNIYNWQKMYENRYGHKFLDIDMEREKSRRRREAAKLW